MFIRIVKGLREQAKPKNFLLPLLTVLLAKIKGGGVDGGCQVGELDHNPDLQAAVSKNQDTPEIVFDSRENTFILLQHLKFISIYIN